MFNLQTNVEVLTGLNNQRKGFITVSEATERLSSAKQINKGADDPSGLGITAGMKARVRGMNVAVQNAQDVMKYEQMGDKGMSLIRNMLLRMRDLSVRSANSATLTSLDQSRLNDELQSLALEITRTAKTAESGFGTSISWPGRGIIDLVYVFDTTGSMGAVIAAAKAALAGFVGTLRGNNVDWAIGLVDYRDQSPIGDPFGWRLPIFYNLTTSQATAQANINTMAAGAGGDLPESGLEALQMAMTSTTWRYAVGTPNYSRQMIMVTDVGGNWTNHDNAAGPYAGDGLSALDTITMANSLAAGGYTVHIAGQVAAAQNIILATTTGGQLGNIAGFNNVLTSILNSIPQDVTAPTYERIKTMQIGPDSKDHIDFTFQDCRAVGLGVNSLNITSTAGAQNAISSIDTALKTLGNYQAQYGYLDKRLTSIIEDLAAGQINLTAASSRIVDADMAQEATKLAKSQILSQEAVTATAFAAEDRATVMDLLDQHSIGQSEFVPTA